MPDNKELTSQRHRRICRKCLQPNALYQKRLFQDTPLTTPIINGIMIEKEKMMIRPESKQIPLKELVPFEIWETIFEAMMKQEQRRWEEEEERREQEVQG